MPVLLKYSACSTCPKLSSCINARIEARWGLWAGESFRRSEACPELPPCPDPEHCPEHFPCPEPVICLSSVVYFTKMKCKREVKVCKTMCKTWCCGISAHFSSIFLKPFKSPYQSYVLNTFALLMTTQIFLH